MFSHLHQVQFYFHRIRNALKASADQRMTIWTIYVTKSRTASSKAPRAVPLTAETSFKTILIYFGFVLVRGGETPSLFITAADRWRLYHVMLGNFSVAKHLLWWHVMKCDDIFEFKLTMQVKITHHASSNEGNTTNLYDCLQRHDKVQYGEGCCSLRNY